MASLGFHCVGNQNLRLGTITNQSNPSPSPIQISRFRSSLSISNDSVKHIPQKISMAVASKSKSLLSRPCNHDLNSHNKTPEKIDEWMRESVSEIVKNLREAPLIVQVYANDNNNGSSSSSSSSAMMMRLKTEKAIAEEWPIITKKWKNEEIPSPDGLILVEELEDERDFNGVCEEEGGEEEKGEKAWGVVIQGKGFECGPACYLLKTSRVGSGLGLFCTHFCLAKVKSFRESALSQLTDCWLL